MTRLRSHAAAPPRSHALHRYAVCTAAMTFFLLIAGGMVTSTDSGLAVPDWPLSYGMLFPPMVGGIFYEHGHRMVAGVVALLILGLAVWTWRTPQPRWLKRLAAAALGGVILQALLGGLTVLLLLSPHVSIAHACLGQTVFCLVACLAIGAAPGGLPEVPAAPPALRGAVGVVACCAAIQLLLGALIRHTSMAVLPHLVGAATLVLATVWAVLMTWRHRLARPDVWPPACRLLLLVTVQVALGLSVFLRRDPPAWLRTGHLAIGALVLAQGVVWCWLAWRGRPDPHQAISDIEHKARGVLRLISDIAELTKPRLTSLVLVTTAAGYWLGRHGGSASAWGMASAVFGTALVAGGANALNEWMERDADAKMHRTRGRPLPTGRVAPRTAGRFGAGCVAAGIVWLAVMTNALAAFLAAASAGVYVALYTPLKSRTALCTLTGAIPGALPPVIGWAAARGTVGMEAWALFLLLFVWQLPHFLSIALLFRDDYALAGHQMLPVTEPAGLVTARQMVIYGLVLVPISVFPAVLGMAGYGYFLGAAALSGMLLGAAVWAAASRSPRTARVLFRSSIIYLPLLLGLLVLTATPRG